MMGREICFNNLFLEKLLVDRMTKQEEADIQLKCQGEEILRIYKQKCRELEENSKWFQDKRIPDLIEQVESLTTSRKEIEQNLQTRTNELKESDAWYNDLINTAQTHSDITTNQENVQSAVNKNRNQTNIGRWFYAESSPVSHPVMVQNQFDVLEQTECESTNNETYIERRNRDGSPNKQIMEYRVGMKNKFLNRKEIEKDVKEARYYTRNYSMHPPVVNYNSNSENPNKIEVVVRTDQRNQPKNVNLNIQHDFMQNSGTKKESQLVDCNYFLKGRCDFRSICRFSHRGNTRYCRYYEKGNCSRGNQCTYSHKIYDNLCLYRQKDGMCSNIKCKYSHRVNADICNNFIDGNCKLGNTCNKYHRSEFNEKYQQKLKHQPRNYDQGDYMNSLRQQPISGYCVEDDVTRCDQSNEPKQPTYNNIVVDHQSYQSPITHHQEIHQHADDTSKVDHQPNQNYYQEKKQSY